MMVRFSETFPSLEAGAGGGGEAGGGEACGGGGAEVPVVSFELSIVTSLNFHVIFQGPIYPGFAELVSNRLKLPCNRVAQFIQVEAPSRLRRLRNPDVSAEEPLP